MNQDFIVTFTKRKFSPFSAQEREIEIIDIAHALSLLCRANGHIRYFYSVAQHCLNCLNEAKARGLSLRIQMACLLHDASEAYLSDITRPVKRSLPQYRDIEEVLQQLIYRRFHLDQLTEEETDAVSKIDDSLLYYELLELMNEEIFDEKPELFSFPDLKQRDFTEIEAYYLAEYDSLASKMKEKSVPH